MTDKPRSETSPVTAHIRNLATPLSGLYASVVKCPELAAPTAFELPEIRLQEWGVPIVEELPATLRMQEGLLRADVRGGSMDQRRVLFDSEANLRISDCFLRGISVTGECFEACRVSLFGAMTVGPECAVEVGFQIYDWRLLREPAPSLWFGCLHGIPAGVALPWRNLGLAEDRIVADLYLNQTDGYDYVLSRVKSGDNARDVLFIDTKGKGAPERDALTSDIKTLEFLHAMPLRIDLLRGASDDGQPLTAYVGSCFGDYELRPRFAEWPIVPDSQHCWAAPAFHRLAPEARHGSPIILLAMDYFLASFRDATGCGVPQAHGRHRGPRHRSIGTLWHLIRCCIFAR